MAKKIEHTEGTWKYFSNHEGDYSIVKNQNEDIQIFIAAVESKDDAKRIVDYHDLDKKS